jgi:hypothetical protein
MPKTKATRHLVIAGTGRTGTTFLVRYLTELGMDTHIKRRGDAQFDRESQAGLEDMPLIDDDLPYVVKAPWIGEYIDSILRSDKIRIDAVVVPMRDLVEAAASRAIVELRALHQNAPWMSQRLDETFEVWAGTPGGIIYSLNPLDQARLLAVGFHYLVHRLVEADIPIVFITFPRLIVKADYAFECLRRFLPAGTTRELAREAHRRTARFEKVRVEQEFVPATPTTAARHVGHGLLDRVGLAREVERLRTQYIQLHSQLQDLGPKLETANADCVQLRSHEVQLAGELQRANSERTRLESETQRLAAELEAANAERARLQSETQRLSIALQAASARPVQPFSQQEVAPTPTER